MAFTICLLDHIIIVKLDLQVYEMFRRLSRLKRTIISLVIVFLTILLLIFSMFVYSWNHAREYQEDLVIDIPARESHIIIREWRFLLGSGAEVYYSDESGSETLLDGTLSGGDDGYMPFTDGKYEILFYMVSVRWFTGLGTQDGWQVKSYKLP